MMETREKALRLFVETNHRLPDNRFDWQLIVDLEAWLEDGSRPQLPQPIVREPITNPGPPATMTPLTGHGGSVVLSTPPNTWVVSSN